GYDWKSYNGSGYSIKDSLVYFIKTLNDDIWKVVFTDFASADGKFVFSKQRLYATGIEGVGNNKENTLALYPNPSNGAPVTIVYDLAAGINNALLNVTDMNGRIVYKDMLNAQPGMQQYTLPSGIPGGA